MSNNIARQVRTGIRLNCDGLSARAFDLFDNRSSGISALRISNRHACPVGYQSLASRRGNSSRAASDYCDLARQFLSIGVMNA